MSKFHVLIQFKNLSAYDKFVFPHSVTYVYTKTSVTEIQDPRDTVIDLHSLYIRIKK